MAPDFVDDRGRVVFLILGREIVIGTQKEGTLFLVLTLFFGFGNRRDQIGTAPRLENAVGRLSV